MSQFSSALTIDVEDGISISMRDNFRMSMKPTGRVVDNVGVILDICEKNGIIGTFFILGEVAERFPELVKKIHKAGHEIGVHGYYHDQVFRLNPDSLRKSISKAKDLMENLSGQEVYGFRAPAFSVNPKTAWALPVIASCGFKYDSSIFPSLSIRYGWKNFSKHICRIQMNDSASLVEVPLSVINVLGRDLPVGGGGYLRYFPYSWTRKALNSILDERPAIVYLHPYELDVKKYPGYFHNAIARAPIKKRIILSLYRYKKKTVIPKLDQVTREFRFAPLHQIIQDLDSQGNISDIQI
jgi:polysaccharide deacetylase family protein (PEP-CTERM system associated)